MTLVENHTLLTTLQGHLYDYNYPMAIKLFAFGQLIDINLKNALVKFYYIRLG